MRIALISLVIHSTWATRVKLEDFQGFPASEFSKNFESMLTIRTTVLYTTFSDLAQAGASSIARASAEELDEILKSASDQLTFTNDVEEEAIASARDQVLEKLGGKTSDQKALNKITRKATRAYLLHRRLLTLTQRTLEQLVKLRRAGFANPAHEEIDSQFWSQLATYLTKKEKAGMRPDLEPSDNELDDIKDEPGKENDGIMTPAQIKALYEEFS